MPYPWSTGDIVTATDLNAAIDFPLYTIPSGRWVQAPTYAIVDIGGVTAVLGRIYTTLFPISHAVTITKIGGVKGGGASGQLNRAGIYTVGSRGLPDKLVVDAGTVDGSGTGSIVWNTSVALAKGVYCVAFAIQGTAASYAIGAFGATGGNLVSTPGMVAATDWPESAPSARAAGFQTVATSHTGALPSTFGTSEPTGLQFGRVPRAALFAAS